IIGTLMAIKFIEEPVKEIKGIKNFDILGSVLLGIMLGTLCLVLDQGQSWGWSSSESIISYIITAISLISFFVVELRAKEPVVDLKFFKIPTFSASILTSFLSFMGMMGGIFLIPLFAQTYLGYSVTKTGLMFIPLAFGIMISAQVGARIAFKIPARFVIAGGMIWAACVFYSFSAIDIKWGIWDICTRLFLMALGLGLGLAPLTQSATSTVPIHEVGIASSILALARNIAGAFGTAIFATVLSNGVTASLLAIERYSTINTTNPALLQQITALMPIKANIDAYGIVFRSATIFMIIGAIAAMFVKDLRNVQSAHHQPMEL
ncbi:MAG: MFS transporter, partial [Patescibacteria group bacterium]|nr:MFS transporter [Patescibacteria group bacterium]